MWIQILESLQMLKCVYYCFQLMNLSILNFLMSKIFVASLYVLLTILHHQTEVRLFNSQLNHSDSLKNTYSRRLNWKKLLLFKLLKCSKWRNELLTVCSFIRVYLQYFHSCLLTAFLKAQQLMMDSVHDGGAEEGLSDFAGFSKWVFYLKDLSDMVLSFEVAKMQPSLGPWSS